jgi:hypothetical protein
MDKKKRDEIPKKLREAVRSLQMSRRLQARLGRLV